MIPEIFQFKPGEPFSKDRFNEILARMTNAINDLSADRVRNLRAKHFDNGGLLSTRGGVTDGTFTLGPNGDFNGIKPDELMKRINATAAEVETSWDRRYQSKFKQSAVLGLNDAGAGGYGGDESTLGTSDQFGIEKELIPSGLPAPIGFDWSKAEYTFNVSGYIPIWVYDLDKYQVGGIYNHGYSDSYAFAPNYGTGYPVSWFILWTTPDGMWCCNNPHDKRQYGVATQRVGHPTTGYREADGRYSNYGKTTVLPGMEEIRSRLWPFNQTWPVLPYGGRKGDGTLSVGVEDYQVPRLRIRYKPRVENNRLYIKLVLDFVYQTSLTGPQIKVETGLGFDDYWFGTTTIQDWLNGDAGSRLVDSTNSTSPYCYNKMLGALNDYVYYQVGAGDPSSTPDDYNFLGSFCAAGDMKLPEGRRYLPSTIDAMVPPQIHDIDLDVVVTATFRKRGYPE